MKLAITRTREVHNQTAMMSNNMKLGYERETGEQVNIPITHTFLSGITRHGKSEAMKAMADRAAENGHTVLLFDVKSKRDYGDIGCEIPVYLEEVAEPAVVKSLLNSVVDASVAGDIDFAELVKIIEKGDDYRQVLSRVRDALDDDNHPVRESKLFVIEHLMERLVEDLDSIGISDSLDLEPGVNVMDLSSVDDSVKQVAIKSTVERVNSSMEDVIVGIDEAHNFVPQSGNPPANRPIAKLFREGGAAGNWVWLSDQTITGVDKDPLKQVKAWVVGKQGEVNEANRALDQIPGSTGYSGEDITTLTKGHFVVGLDDRQPTVYVQPRWMSDEEAKTVAQGEQSIEDTAEPDTTEMTDLEAQLQEKEDRIRELESSIEEREQTIQSLRETVERLEGELDQATSDGSRDTPKTVQQPSIDEERVRDIIDQRFEEYIEEKDVPKEIEVVESASEIHLSHEVEPITVRTDEPDNAFGKVAYLYATGELPDDKWFTTGDVEEKLAHHGWHDATVKRTDILDRLCRMGFLEMKYSGNRKDYKIKLSPEAAREKGRLHLEEEVVA